MRPAILLASYFTQTGEVWALPAVDGHEILIYNYLLR